MSITINLIYGFNAIPGEISEGLFFAEIDTLILELLGNAEDSDTRKRF